ncbi:MAG: hypothetical protein GXN93_01120 [Candidatus Diapherotrites archaeon]|nr:hypothetical protein [Candidatus Diapherotrites archaeon]
MITLWLDIARYQPLRGASYIALPAALNNKKAVVNVKNRDDDCLRWALRAALANPPPLLHQPGALLGRPSQEDGVDAHGLRPALFIEKGMRGGISMVSKRHARANNPLVEGYNPEKENSYILYLDANNLYDWAMSQPLPTGVFRWVEDDTECQRLRRNIKEHPAGSPEGYIFEVDLEYPQELHNAHNAYPLAPERMVVQKERMSNYQHSLVLRAGAGGSFAVSRAIAPTRHEVVQKLVPNLRHKKRYVLHYRNLQLYMSLGMRLTKVHRALRFEQSPWMDLLKTLVYDFYYNQMKAQYGERCDLLYTDIDSLLLEIPRDPFYSAAQTLSWQDERRVCQAPYRRVYWPAPEDVLDP